MTQTEVMELDFKLQNSSLSADWKDVLLAAADYFILLYTQAEEKIKNGSISEEKNAEIEGKKNKFDQMVENFRQKTAAANQEVPQISLDDCLAVLVKS